MFVFKRNRITKKLIEDLRPTVGIVEIHLGELPQGYWQDPYILGYLSGIFQNIFPFVQETVGKVSDSARALIMIDVLTAISGNEDVITHIIDLKNSKNKEYLRGENNAKKFLSLMFGFDEFADDPDVIEAKKRMDQTPEVLKPPEIFGDVTPAQELAESFQDIIYLDYIRDRFGPNP